LAQEQEASFMVEWFKAGRLAGAGTPAQWLIVGLLAAIAGLLGAEAVFSPSSAGAQTGPVGATQPAGGVFAVAGQITRDTYGLYLVDLRNDTICVYEYVSGRRGALWLRAARTFIYDRQLDAYETKPEPAEIADIVSKARRLRDVKRPKP
jgi:hypothetical protein